MSKRLFVLSTLVLSLGLTACQGETEATLADDEVMETEAFDSESNDSTETEESADESEGEVEELEEAEEGQDDYQAEIEQFLEQAEKQFAADQFDAAAGTLSKLFQYNLSDHEELAEKAEAMKADIQVVQAEKANADLEESAFEKERQSALLAEEYLNATGESIETASDEELENWFESEAAEDQPGNQEIEWTKEEAENYAFDQLIILENLNFENYFFFVNMTDDEWVQLEAREAVDQDGVTWSNLIGLYRYNVLTDELQKLDTVTGEYDTIQNPS